MRSASDSPRMRNALTVDQDNIGKLLQASKTINNRLAFSKEQISRNVGKIRPVNSCLLLDQHKVRITVKASSGKYAVLGKGSIRPGNQAGFRRKRRRAQTLSVIFLYF